MEKASKNCVREIDRKHVTIHTSTCSQFPNCKGSLTIVCWPLWTPHIAGWLMRDEAKAIIEENTFFMSLRTSIPSWCPWPPIRCTYSRRWSGLAFLWEMKHFNCRETRSHSRGHTYYQSWRALITLLYLSLPSRSLAVWEGPWNIIYICLSCVKGNMHTA